MSNIVSPAIRNSARGEACTLNIAGICNYNPETTVFCHFPDESKGGSLKADDISGGYGCSACHDAIDGRSNRGPDAAERDWYMRRSQTRTLRRLLAQRIVTIKGVAA